MSIKKHRSLESFEEALTYIINSYTNGEVDLREVLDAADRVMCYKANVGLYTNRLEYNDREKAFHDQWLEENAPVASINNGHGTLQDLFIERCKTILGARKVLEEISNRDRMLVATIIQWLGSNCGMSFLSEALSRFGAGIVYDEKYKRL